MDKPKITREQIQKVLDKKKIKDQTLIVGIRALMAKNGVNARGVPDDGFCIIGPHTFTTFNGNTDPSSYRKGQGKGAKKGMATLNTGYYKVHQLAMHRGKYLALCQLAGPVTVTRDGNPPYSDFGLFGINIHHMSLSGGTSSLGCQTIFYPQWESFIALVRSEMNAAKISVMPYLLIDAKELSA